MNLEDNFSSKYQSSAIIQGKMTCTLITFWFYIINVDWFSWAEVEDEKTKVNTEDEIAVFASAKKLYEASLRYLDKMRQIEARQVEKLRYITASNTDTGFLVL